MWGRESRGFLIGCICNPGEGFVVDIQLVGPPTDGVRPAFYWSWKHTGADITPNLCPRFAVTPVDFRPAAQPTGLFRSGFRGHVTSDACGPHNDWGDRCGVRWGRRLRDEKLGA